MKSTDTHVAESWTLRRVQAASDLKALVAPHRAALIAAMVAAGGPPGLITDRIGGFLDRPGLTLDPDHGPFVRGWLDAALQNPSLPPMLLQPALAAAFAATILDLRDPFAMLAFWQAHHTQITAYPASQRAAFICALRELLFNSNAEIDPPLDLAHCLSIPREAVCQPLRDIAQTASKSQLHAIAAADYHDSVERHLAALIDVIATKDGVIDTTTDGAWYPLEVVQLRSHCPDEEGHLVATAVVLITAVHNGDANSDAEFRWSRQHAHYLSLPPAPSDAIIAAMRYCYECDMNFNHTAAYDPADSLLIPPHPPQNPTMPD